MERRATDAGIEIAEVYHESSAPREENLGAPGEFPYTRGPYATMYRGKPWTIRQYAGFATAEATNERFHYLLNAGQTGLSCAFDLPTQMGYDADHPLADGEVGKVGVSISTLDDMRSLMQGLPLDRISTSMTINATASTLLLFYQLVGEEQGVSGSQLRGTIQNDILKEYVARGTYIYPPRPSMRLVVDTFAYCAAEMPAFNTISISGYHMREAGATAVQEVAFTLANGIAYVTAARDAGMSVDDFAPRLSFFFNAHSNFFEEVAKYRAARTLWAMIMRDRFDATSPEAMAMRFHTQTAGSTLTAQQPHNNVVRTTLQALSAVLGGTQSLHTNSFDEALGLPTEQAATLAVRTQHILAHETGVADTVDPLAGSYFVESLTSEIIERASDYVERIDALGGAVGAIEAQFPQREIESAAYRVARAIDEGEKIIVGVNAFISGDEEVPVFPSDPAQQQEQITRLTHFKRGRDATAVEAALRDLTSAAAGTSNVLYPMKEAIRVGATLGDVAAALRAVWGDYRP